MTQQIINVGTGPDSYTGESLRTAFQKVNNNFSQLYAGNVGANISGNIITANGFVTSGNVVAGNVTAAGNISAYYFTGDGSQLTGITVSANTGNIAFSNLTISGSVAGNIVLDPAGNGNVSIVSDVIPGANVTYNLGSSTRQWKDLWLSNSTLYLGGFPVTVSNTGALSVNGSPVTSSYGNANVASYLPTYSGNISSGNISTGVITLTNGATIKDNGNLAVAFGKQAGDTSQGFSAVAIGHSAGRDQQGYAAVAIGYSAALGNQGLEAVAVGRNAGASLQGNSAVAIGSGAGVDSQGTLAVAVGYLAGNISQGSGAIAVGTQSGQFSQGINSVAIGSVAGVTNQANNSIILNATGANLNQTTANTFTVSPIRNDVSNIGQVVFYNTTSKEVTYGNTISVAGNVTGNYILGNGSQLTGLPATYSNANVASYLPTYTGNIAGNISKNGNVWIFGTNGTTTFPTNISVDYSGNNVQFPRIIADTGKAFSVQGQGNIGSAALAWTVDPNAASQYAAVSVSRAGGDNLAKVVLQAQSDSGDVATAKTWQFNQTGTTRFPGDTILAPAGTSITMQSDQYSQLYWQNANVTVAPNMAINSNFYVAQNNATLDIVYRDGNSTQQQKSWLWGVDGTLTLPTAGRINFDYLSISSDANVSAFYAPAGNVQLAAGTGNAQIVANSLNDSKTWIFGTDGNLALPHSGVLLVSGGITAGPTIASPAPYLSGFSSISAVSMSASGNISSGNMSTGVITLTNGAVIKDNAGDSVAFGQSAGATSQGNSAVAIGHNAGVTSQGTFTVAIGRNAGQTSQGGGAVAVGVSAGDGSQGAQAVAVGNGAGGTNQGNSAVAIGISAGQSTQGVEAVAIGNSAGSLTQGISAIAIGKGAGRNFQGNNSIIINATGADLDQTTANTFTVAPVRNDVANVAEILFYNTTSKEVTYGNTISVAGNITGGNISTGVITLTNGAVIKDTAFDAIAFGQGAGQISQDTYAVAIGTQAGYTTQNVAAVAVGSSAGQTNQGASAVAIGSGAGATDQSGLAVAIGQLAGETTQGVAAVAIGSGAGRTSQGNYSIILNATGANLNATTANTFTVAPVRNDVSNVAQVVFYNTTSKEITYGNTISVAGNISAGNLNVTGNIVDTGALSIITGSNGNIALIPNGTGIVTVSNALTVAGNITGNTGGFAIGYRDIPQVVFTSNATLALTDAGKHYFSSNSANIITVPNNTTVSFNIGTAISIVQQGTANLTVTPGSGVTMYLAGNSTSSSRTLGNYGMATLMKVDTNTWFINGTGVN